MGDEDIKADHGHSIDAFLSAQDQKSNSLARATAGQQQEMIETPLRACPLAAGTAAPPENRMARSPRRRKPYSGTTVVKLVSTNATSSAFPESFGFGTSVSGRWLAAYSSSALYLISTAHLPSYKGTCRAFRIWRKPLAVAITDTGRFAVLTTSHKIDIYQCGSSNGDLLQGTCKKLETVHLDNEAKTLAFARCGEIVAAGSDIGLEIKSLSQDSRETDKRYITCSPADRLMFARDGRGLLATSVAKKSRFSTFIALNESFEDAFVEEEEVEQQPLGKLWITQLLFPERLSCRSAALLPLTTTDMSNSEILAFDSHMDMFKVFDVTMKRFTDRELGTPSGVIWTRHHKPEEAIPAISADAAAIAFAVRTKHEKEIWVYHVPPAWWEPESSSPESAHAQDAENNLDATESIKLPALEDRAPPETITSLQWVESNNEEQNRLVAIVSTVNIAVPEEAVPIEAPAASGKVFLFDFNDNERTAEDMTATMVVDLGEVAVSDELTDEVLALEREVDLVRRRTQMQRSRPPAVPLHSPRGSLRRSMSSGSTPGSGVPTLRDLTYSNSGRSNSGRSARRRRSFSSLSSANDGTDDNVVPMDEPYSQTQPRSQFSLHRAATIAANAPANRQHLRALPERPLEYRRADGLREIPHESDADNWVPPPPLYSERPDNVMSHPMDQRAASTFVPRPQRAPSQTQHRLSRPLSNVPPVPPLPHNSRYIPQGQSVMPQRNGSTVTPAPLHATSLPHPPFMGHASARSRNRNRDSHESLASSPSRLPARPQTAGTLRNGQHRHAESVSSTSSRTSQNHVASQQATSQSSLLNSSHSSTSITRNTSNDMHIITPPSMSLVTQGQPLDMSPPSPIADLTRPSTVRQDTPSPNNNPLFNQFSTIHNQTDSVDSTRRAVRGQQNNDGPLRMTSPLDLVNALPLASEVSSGHSYSPSRSSPRSEPRPPVSRLATIASVSEQQSQQDFNFGVHTTIHGPNTAPTTPLSRKPWWRVGGSGSARDLPRSESRQMRSESRQQVRSESRQERPESRIVQYAAVEEMPRRVVTTSATAGTGKKTKAREKDGGASRCTVM